MSVSVPAEFASKAVVKDRNANGWVCYKEFTSGSQDYGYVGGEFKSGLVLIDDKIGDPELVVPDATVE